MALTDEQDQQVHGHQFGHESVQIVSAVSVSMVLALDPQLADATSVNAMVSTVSYDSSSSRTSVMPILAAWVLPVPSVPRSSCRKFHMCPTYAS